MTMYAVSSTVQVLAVIGLALGLVVLLVVLWLLHNTLAPLRKVSADVQQALTAPMLERGVPGTDQLGQTRRLAESVPPLALAYLQKLSVGASAPAPAPAATTPEPVAAPTPASNGGPELPAWKLYGR
jgi:hypothetical protein